MWEAQSIQLVWFVKAHDGLNAADLFRAGFGEEADNIQSNRVVTPAKPFLSQASGILEERSVMVQVQPGRVDLVVQGDQLHFDPQQGPRVFDLVEELNRLQRAAEAFGAALTSTIRLSTVVVLVSPAASGGEALRKCLEQTEINCPVDGVTDFFFQANKRVRLAGRFDVNRLLRWNVFELHSMAVNVDGLGQQALSQLVTYRAGLMLDFNTLLSDQPFSAEDQSLAMHSIHDELLRIARLEFPLRDFAI